MLNGTLLVRTIKTIGIVGKMPTNMCSGRGYKFCLKKGIGPPHTHFTFTFISMVTYWYHCAIINQRYVIIYTGEECNTVVIIAWNIKLGLVSSTLTLLRAPRTLEHNTT